MIDNKEYKPRIIDKEVERYLSVFGAVCIEGAKWCGKTWTSMHHANSYVLLGDPTGNFQNRQLAQISPATVLAGPQPRLIDEWQEVPPLWDAVRASVDHNPVKGQFLLTGSATPNHKGVLHSGAGRIARLRMRPMSLFESGDSSGLISLKEVCEGRLTPVMTGEVDLRKIIRLILRGGWPAALSLKPEDFSLLPHEYLKAVVNDDVFRTDGVKRDIQKMWLLLRSLARHESSTATKTTLIKDIHQKDEQRLSNYTVDEYLDIFKRLFLTDNIEPFSASGLRSALRVKQAEKLHSQILLWLAVYWERRKIIYWETFRHWAFCLRHSVSVIFESMHSPSALSSTTIRTTPTMKLMPLSHTQTAVGQLLKLSPGPIKLMRLPAIF